MLQTSLGSLFPTVDSDPYYGPPAPSYIPTGPTRTPYDDYGPPAPPPPTATSPTITPADYYGPPIVPSAGAPTPWYRSPLFFAGASALGLFGVLYVATRG
jgi:hypothetical protein